MNLFLDYKSPFPSNENDFSSTTDIMLLKLFEPNLEQIEIIEILKEIQKYVTIRNELPDSFFEFDILDQLIHIFDENKNPTFSNFMLIFFINISEFLPNDEDIFVPILEFCLIRFSQQDFKYYILILLSKLIVISNEANEYLMKKINMEFIDYVLDLNSYSLSLESSFINLLSTIENFISSIFYAINLKSKSNSISNQSNFDKSNKEINQSETLFDDQDSLFLFIKDTFLLPILNLSQNSSCPKYLIIEHDHLIILFSSFFGTFNDTISNEYIITSIKNIISTFSQENFNLFTTQDSVLLKTLFDSIKHIKHIQDENVLSFIFMISKLFSVDHESLEETFYESDNQNSKHDRFNYSISSSLVSYALTTLDEIATNVEYRTLQYIQHEFLPQNYIDKPSLIPKEATKLLITLLDRLNSSDKVELLNEKSIELLLKSLFFDDEDLRRNIFKSLYNFDKELVMSQINDEIYEFIEESIEINEIEDALELL